MNILEQINNNLYGINASNPEFVKELDFIRKYYKFYEGRIEGRQDEDDPDLIVLEAEGQLWKVTRDKYEATRQVRNLTKKLINRQARFMFSTPPTLQFKPYGTETDPNAKLLAKQKAEDKRALIDRIFEDTDFWPTTQTAFLDCTIGKRVLLLIDMDKTDTAQPLNFRYFTAEQFTYAYDPIKPKRLKKVQIVYQDESTIGALSDNQIWYRITYEMRTNQTRFDIATGAPIQDATCWCVYEELNGNNVIIQDSVVTGYDEVQGTDITQNVERKREWNTELSEIPAYVVLNDPLTGETKGRSDVKDLMDMAMSYNRKCTDYNDALTYKLFEPLIVIDADQDDITDLKVTPNAVINIHTDPAALGEGSDGSGHIANVAAKATFNWQPAADAYLDRLKNDLYEFMDQPLPSQVKDIPSAKAMRFLFYDLMGRCDTKWLTWEPCIKWVINFIIKAIEDFNLYPDLKATELVNIDTNIIIQHNYPIPEDAEVTKATAISEVQANVMSHKEYISQFGNVEDEDAEWQQIMNEMDSMNQSNSIGMNVSGFDEEGGGDNGNEEGQGEEESN